MPFNLTLELDSQLQAFVEMHGTQLPGVARHLGAAHHLSLT